MKPSILGPPKPVEWHPQVAQRPLSELHLGFRTCEAWQNCRGLVQGLSPKEVSRFGAILVPLLVASCPALPSGGHQQPLLPLITLTVWTRSVIQKPEK